MTMEWDGPSPDWTFGKTRSAEVSYNVYWNKAFRVRTFRTDINKTTWFSTVYEKRVPGLDNARIFETVGEDDYLMRKLAGTVDDEYVVKRSTRSVSGRGNFVVM